MCSEIQLVLHKLLPNMRWIGLSLVILNLSALTLCHLRRVMIPYEKHHSYEEKISVFYFNICKTVDMKCNFNTTG